MSYTEGDVSAARAAMDKYRGKLDGEVAAALAVVGLSAERAHKEAKIRDDMIPCEPGILLRRKAWTLASRADSQL